MYLVVSNKSRLYNPNYNEIQKFPYDLSTLNDEPMILLSKELELRREIDEFYELNHLEQKVVLATSNLYTAVSLTKVGIGSTFVIIYKKNRSLTPSQLCIFTIKVIF